MVKGERGRGGGEGKRTGQAVRAGRGPGPRGWKGPACVRVCVRVCVCVHQCLRMSVNGRVDVLVRLSVTQPCVSLVCVCV